MSERNRWIFGVLTVGGFSVYAALWSCKGAECIDRRGCSPGQECIEERCVNREPMAPRPIPDAGPDSGLHPDAQSDAEAGVADAADSGVGSDSGPTDTLTSPRQGIVWIGEFPVDTNTSTFTAFAELVDRSAAQFEVRQILIPNLQPASVTPDDCDLNVLRQTGGSVAAIGARQVDVVPRPGITVTMIAVGAQRPGRFEPSLPPGRGFFDFTTVASYQITGNGVTGLLDAMYQGAHPRLIMNASPAPGSNISTIAEVGLLWQMRDPTAIVTVELYDGRREVVLQCRTADRGSYVVTLGALNAWRNQGPTGRTFLEVRYDVDSTPQNLPLLGGGTLPVTFRASHGVRYPVTP